MYVVLFARGMQDEVDAQLRWLNEVAQRQRWTVVAEYAESYLVAETSDVGSSVCSGMS